MPCRFSWIRAARRSRAAFRCQKSVKGIEDNDLDNMTYLVLNATSLHLVAKDLRTGLLGLGLVNVFHQHTFVLEDVTLGLLVQRVIPKTSAMRSSVRRVTAATTHRCLSIFPASLYFLNNRRKTLCLRIQRILVGILASLVPFLLPGPVCLPFLFAASRSRVRARECTVVGLMIT